MPAYGDGKVRFRVLRKYWAGGPKIVSLKMAVSDAWTSISPTMAWNVMSLLKKVRLGGPTTTSYFPLEAEALGV